MISSAAIASTIIQVQVLSSSILANEANSLKLWPEEHSQRRAFRVDLGQPSGGLGKVRCGARGPLKLPRHPDFRGSHIRTSQTDPAPRPNIWPWIVNFGARDNAPSFGCPVHHSQAYTQLNAAAYEDELGTEGSQLRPFAGSFAGTKLLLLECQLRSRIHTDCCLGVAAGLGVQDRATDAQPLDRPSPD